MQLNVERGPMATGKTIRLRQIAKADGQSEEQILNGRNTSQMAMERKVRHLISRGAKVICIDECSEELIDRLQGLKGNLPSDLTIHAVVAN